MSSDITEKVNEAIKARINEVVDLDAIKTLVDAEIQRLLKPPANAGYGGGYPPSQSILANIIQREVAGLVTEKVKATISRPEFEEKICQTVATHLVGEESAPAVQAVVRGMVEGFLRTIRGY